MKLKITPGEWEWSRGKFTNSYVTLNTSTSSYAVLFPDMEVIGVHPIDALAISRVPEMLALIKSALEESDTGGDDVGFSYDNYEKARALLEGLVEEEK